MTKRYEEDQIQMRVVEFLRFNRPNILFTCAPATSKNPREGSKKKKMGYCKGWPDLFIACPINPFHGMALELKTDKGVLSKDQLEVLRGLEVEGYYVRVGRSVAKSIILIEDYLNQKTGPETMASHGLFLTD